MSDKQVRAQYTREFKLEAVRQVRAGQAIAVVAKVLGIPKASLANWVRLAAKGAVILPELGEIRSRAMRPWPTAVLA
jgi:transposase-like protein